MSIERTEKQAYTTDLVRDFFAGDIDWTEYNECVMHSVECEVHTFESYTLQCEAAQ